MFSLPRPCLVLVLSALPVGTIACGVDAAPPAPEPTFQAGPLVARTLDLCGGVTLEVPDNVTPSPSTEGFTLEGEGFPTLTVTCHETRMTGTGAGGGGGSRTPQGGTTTYEVERTRNIPRREWRCVGETQSAQNRDLMNQICESMRVVFHPNVEDLSCEVSGFDEAAVNAAWQSAMTALLACIEPDEDMPNRRLTFTHRPGGQPSFDISFRRETDRACAEQTLAGLRGHAALASPASDDASVSCEGTYHPYQALPTRN